MDVAREMREKAVAYPIGNEMEPAHRLGDRFDRRRQVTENGAMFFSPLPNEQRFGPSGREALAMTR